MDLSINDAQKDVQLPDGTEVKWFQINPMYMVDKSIIVVGGTNTGKTVIAMDILYQYREVIPNVIVVAPQTTAEKFYEGIVPKCCIKHDLTKEMLQTMWKRQENIAMMYNTANRMENLQSLFNVSPCPTCARLIFATVKRAQETIAAIQINKHLNFVEKNIQIRTVQDLRNAKLIEYYKLGITRQKDIIAQQPLTDIQRITLNAYDINPRMLLTIDDCTERIEKWMKMFKKDEENIFEAIAFRGRHIYFTLLFIAQDDKFFTPDIRKGAMITIFTSSQAFITAINRPASGYSSNDKKLAQRIAPHIYMSSDSKKRSWNKVCYLREDNDPFRYMLADYHEPFTLGSEGLYELSNRLLQSEASQENNLIDRLTGQKKKKSGAKQSSRKMLMRKKY